MFDLDALQAAAEAATPGPWTSSVIRVENDADGKARGAGAVRGREGNGYVFMSANGPEILVADAVFIAAANPAVVLELVASHRSALARIARVEALHVKGSSERVEQTPDGPRVAGFDYYCPTCADDHEERAAWPCQTVRALTDDPVA